jgi:hypothetical protein
VWYLLIHTRRGEYAVGEFSSHRQASHYVDRQVRRGVFWIPDDDTKHMALPVSEIDRIHIKEK